MKGKNQSRIRLGFAGLESTINHMIEHAKARLDFEDRRTEKSRSYRSRAIHAAKMATANDSGVTFWLKIGKLNYRIEKAEARRIIFGICRMLESGERLGGKRFYDIVSALEWIFKTRHRGSVVFCREHWNKLKVMVDGGESSIQTHA